MFGAASCNTNSGNVATVTGILYCVSAGPERWHTEQGVVDEDSQGVCLGAIHGTAGNILWEGCGQVLA